MISSRDEFLGMRSNRDLANYLGVPLRTLTCFAYSGGQFYTSFPIPKKTGNAVRKIDAPCPKLKEMQRYINQALVEIYDAPDCVHGFVPARSIVTNAALHVDRPTVVKVDLKSFFRAFLPVGFTVFFLAIHSAFRTRCAIRSPT